MNNNNFNQKLLIYLNNLTIFNLQQLISTSISNLFITIIYVPSLRKDVNI